jgi:protein-S-isoprenylcysteine O-methyltransferase Ste14
VRSRAAAAVGSLLFLVAAPGTMSVYLPWLLTRWEPGPPPLGAAWVRLAGAPLLLFGAALLLDCFRRFAWEGRGTPAPVAPTEALVASGAYRHVRNPMYVAMLALVLGQALILGRRELLGLGAALWAAFHAFVLLYEEPTLEARYGASYRAFRAAVPRWVPRLHPWRG